MKCSGGKGFSDTNICIKKSVLCEYTEISCSAGALKITDSSRISMDQLYMDQIRLESLDTFV